MPDRCEADGVHNAPDNLGDTHSRNSPLPDFLPHGIQKVTTGFGHAAILSHANTVVEAVKSGAIRHFFLVAGCDGAKPGRNYYTEFVKQTPSDSIVLTLAYGKFRFNDLELGEIGGLPRLMDMG